MDHKLIESLHGTTRNCRTGPLDKSICLETNYLPFCNCIQLYIMIYKRRVPKMHNHFFNRLEKIIFNSESVFNFNYVILNRNKEC